MRIGIITHNYPSSKGDRQNAGIFVYDFAHALKKSNQEVFVLAPKSNASVGKMDIPVTWFGWAGQAKKLGDLKLYNPVDLWLFINLLYSGCRAAAKFSKDKKIDFIIGMWSFPAGIFALWANMTEKVPYCLWSLGSDIYIYARYPILRTMIKIALQKAKFLLADGVDLAKETEKLAGRKCDFLPSASKLYDVTQNSKKQSKGKNKTVLAFLGRMELVKGPDILLSALINIKDVIDKFEVHFMSNGSLLPILEERARIAGISSNITFHGSVSESEKINIIKQADWLIIPSRSDSIPLIFSEAMKLCVPVVAASLPDLKYLVKKYNVGFLFEPENTRELAKIIKGLPEEKDRWLTFSNSTKEVGKLFSPEESAKELIERIR